MTKSYDKNAKKIVNLKNQKFFGYQPYEA